MADKAAKAALQWAYHDHWHNWVDDKEVDYDEESIKDTYLYDALSYLPRPTFSDARRICRIVAKASDSGVEEAWSLVGEVLESIRSYERDNPGEIKHPRAYFFKCLKNEFVNVAEEDEDDDNYTEDDGAYERAVEADVENDL